MGQFSDTCVACGCEPTLAAFGFSGRPASFYQACMRAHLAGPSAQLAVALYDCGLCRLSVSLVAESVLLLGRV